ncbi:chitinase [Caballeronia sp. LZ001]|uniref:glycoside hydrolase family 19 protein n=1 Tax=Caballeronia sp. LZ001 TaxID=3038553 RepID=UPI002861F9B2|nr:chitinase [Caballeronia sp. LZ001]MDR5799558.1 chitinase [Caballeronia sp. LZ001]
MPRSAPPDTKVKQISFGFPFLKKGQRPADAAAKFTDEHEVYQMLANKEPSGSYLVSKSGMWHGGIHITDTGAGTQLDLNQGVRCIADGHVIAYRVNRAYPVSQVPASSNQPASQALYSTGFALVRHTMEFPKGKIFTFYSVYMHLQAYDDYERDVGKSKPLYWSTQFKVTEHARDKPEVSRTGSAADPGQQGLTVRATPRGGQRGGHAMAILPQGACVSIGEQQHGWGKITDVHGAQLYAPQAGGVPPSTAVGGWIFLGNENGGPLVQAFMPDDTFDRVVVTASTLDSAGDSSAQGTPIKAGDLIGHLGRYDSLNAGSSATRMAHIEAFCDDSVQTFIDQSRTWIGAHGAHKDDWTPLGLSVEPTILRIDTQTKLFHDAEREGASAPMTGVVQRWSLGELARDRNKQHVEQNADRTGRKVNWWRVGSADPRGQAIEGWVREEAFAGGRVTREFAQTWVDFSCIDDAHDPAHSMFATTQAWVDYAGHANVPDAKSLTKLSPMMRTIYRVLFPQGDGSGAADDMCVSYAGESGHYPWLMQRASRLIVKHESEWANPDKWKQLYAEIERVAGRTPQYDEEQKRIEKLVWWDEVKAKVPGFPGSDVFHINPIGLVANFFEGACACKGAELHIEALGRIAPQAGAAKLQEYLPALNKAFADFSLDTCITRAHFIAQMLTESGQFRYTKELGTERKIYDPWRGRGLIQLTHKENYDLYGNYVHEDFTSSAAAMAKLETAPHAMLSAAWYYSIHAALAETGDNDDFIWVTRSINGAFIGYDDRLNFLNRAIEVLGLQNCAKLNRDGKYLFEESKAYNEKRASFAWGLWHDPAKNKPGIAKKDANEAIKGYSRYLELDNRAGKPLDKHGKFRDQGWYGIGKNICVRDVAETRINSLQPNH